MFFVNKGIMENILKHGTTCFYWWHDKWLTLHKADKSMAKYKLISGRYVYLYNQPKQNGVLSSCMQDAVINAATHLGVKLSQKEMYQRCQPRKVKGITIKELSRSLEDKLLFVPIPGIANVKDGIEASLLRYVDGKVQMAVAEVTNNNVPKNHHHHQSKHAFIHLAFPLKTYDHPHIGVIIDNRKK